MPHLIIVSFLIFLIRKLIPLHLSYSDFTPFSNNPFNTLEKFLFIWKEDFIGFLDVKSISYLIRYIFEIIFKNAALAQSSYILTFMLIGYYGMNQVLKQFNISKLIRYIGSLFFIINPVMAAEYSNGAAGIFIIYSLIPWIFILLKSSLENYNLKKGLLYSLLIAICFLNLQTMFWILIPLLIFNFILLILKNKLKIVNFIKILFHTFLGLIINTAALFSLALISQNYSSVSYLDTFNYTYRGATFINLFRGFGNWGSSQVNLGYFGINPINLISFLLLVSILLYLLYFFKQESKEKKENFISILIVSLGIMGIIWMVKEGIFNPLIENKNIFIVSLRNPQKLFYSFIFFFLVISSFSFDKIYINLKKNYKKVSYFIPILFLLIFLLPNSHFLGGDFGLQDTKEDSFYIERDYLNLHNFIENSHDEGHFLYLPFDYNTELKNTNQAKVVKFKLGASMSSDSQNSKIIENLYTEICSNKTPIETFEKLNIKYIIIDKFPNTYLIHDNKECYIEKNYGTPYIWGNSLYFKDLFSGNKIVFENNRFIIYDTEIKLNPKVESINSTYEYKNPGLYKLYIPSIKSKTEIILRESYHEGWNLYLRKVSSSENFVNKLLHSLWDKPISDETHEIFQGYGNSWILDPEYIKKNYSEEYYLLNEDESITLKLDIYFEPQTYFNLGLIISSILMITLIYLIFYLKDNKPKEGSEKCH
jgi:hypothetical protein